MKSISRIGIKVRPQLNSSTYQWHVPGVWSRDVTVWWIGLLFAGRIMNLSWIIGIAAYVLLEKLAPNDRVLARISGVTLIIASVWLELSLR